MLKFKHIAPVAMAVAALSIATDNAYAASGTGNATATIVTPITITPGTDLAFGKIAAGTGGTVVISTASARSKTGGVTLVSTGSTQTAATFAIAGDANSTYAITLPADGVVTISDGATHTMNVDTFVSNPSGTGTLSAGGAQTVNVGATLTVGAAQTPNAYTGTFAVVVDYN